MSWEWVASTATAAVGLAGIAATWFTARASRIDQRNMALRETRQNAYAVFLTDLYNLRDSAEFARTPDDEREVMLAYNINRSRAQVRILASNKVKQFSDQLVPIILRYKASAVERGINGLTLYGINNALGVLETLMANDLGFPSGATPGDFKKYFEANFPDERR